MKPLVCFLTLYIFAIASNSCTNQKISKASDPEIQGTWKLISGTTIEKNDTVVTNYLNGRSFIKVINSSHFAFIGHDLVKGKDTTAFFSSGGGTYELKDSSYVEHLEYCNAREWEGNSFHFTIRLNNDTLVQEGIEKIDSIGVNRVNIEKYVRYKE